MERPHGQLGSRLANRLRRDNSDRLAHFHPIVGGQVAPVTLNTKTLMRLTSQVGTDIDFFNTGIFDGFHHLFGDRVISFHQNFTGKRIDHIFQCGSAQQTLTERLDDFTRLHQRRHFQAAQGATIFFHNNDVLRHIHQTAGEVTRVCRLERGVRQTFARTMRGDEVLDHRQSFTKVRGDGSFNDFARRLRHQAAHSGKLTQLLRTATRTGIGHDENRIKILVLVTLTIDQILIFSFQLFKHFL